MGTRRILSAFLLSVYSIILVHNFVPHDHHLTNIGCNDGCSTHNIQQPEECGIIHHNKEGDAHNHLHCHFNVKTIVKQGFGFPLLHIPAQKLKSDPVKENGSVIPFFYYPEKDLDTFTSDVGSRAPPVFS